MRLFANVAASPGGLVRGMPSSEELASRRDGRAATGSVISLDSGARVRPGPRRSASGNYGGATST